jgi:hypothetical protein
MQTSRLFADDADADERCLARDKILYRGLQEGLEVLGECLPLGRKLQQRFSQCLEVPGVGDEFNGSLRTCDEITARFEC